MSIVIKVEHLSKSYMIRHQSTERYSTLRDALAEKTKKVFSAKRLNDNKNLEFQKKELFWALKNVNLEINQGDRIGVIGRNGAGKSTLLKIFSRITEPTEGRISIKGRIASLLEVGTGFHPELTGRENIYLNGAVLGMPRAEIKRKFDEIVDFSGIEKFLDTPIKRYSSGMYVRLAFAVAAFLESEILIIDEVLAVGDAEFQKKCIGKMDEASAKEGRTVIFVSHNMAVINMLCSKGILLKNGAIIDKGEIKSVVASYLKNEKFDKSFNHLKGNGLIKINQVFINGVEFEGDIKINQEVLIEVFLDFQKKMEFNKIHFFIVIFDESGNDVLSIFQKDSQKPFDVYEAKGKVCINFVNNLRPGTYKISIGIFNEFNEFIDWVDNCFFMRVLAQFVNQEQFDNNRLGKLIAKASFYFNDVY